MSTIETVTRCPITDSTGGFTYIDLGEMPLVNNLVNTRYESINCKKYPLSVQYFSESKLSCLTHNVNPDLLFSEYAYKSGVSKAYSDHCKEMYWFADSYLFFNDGDSILDIGGNDGTLLKVFLERKSTLDVLNIDASVNITKISEENKVPTYTAFWGIETAKKINKKFKLITSTNVFQHTAPIADYVEAVSISLEDKGIWLLEFPYWKTNMETKQFDQIYHEHVYYYLLQPLNTLFEKFGLEIIKAIKYPIHGGSLRLLISKKHAWKPCIGVKDLIEKEKELNTEYYEKWGNTIKEHTDWCKNYLISLKEGGHNIIGFGAAAKGCIFLNSTDIDYNVIDVVIDDTDIKQEKYIPGTGIQIKSRDYIKHNKVDYILILAHNFKDSIMDSLKYDYKGKYIVLFPKIQIL
jgi:2-polyprenyl-3-methyl-5-hydroxy-6-metoxy-1,4-benzoquinol methylase